MRTITYPPISRDEIPVSLKAFLLKQGYSSSMIVAFKHKGGVTVNGEFRRMIDQLLAGDTVKVVLSEEKPHLIANPHLKLTALYEDADLIVFDKPANMLVHPAGYGFDDAVGNYFAAQFPDLTFRPMGRLDRNTTGVCLIAKNRLAAAQLSHNVDKTYLAIAEGNIISECGTVDAPLLRVNGPILTQKVDSLGKPSITHYQVLARSHNHSLIRLKLATGRTHQIRVHMQYLGHPLAGDALYGGSTLLISRQALHCSQMSFAHPISGDKIVVNSPLPKDMANLFSEISFLP